MIVCISPVRSFAQECTEKLNEAKITLAVETQHGKNIQRKIEAEKATKSAQEDKEAEDKDKDNLTTSMKQP